MKFTFPFRDKPFNHISFVKLRILLLRLALGERTFNYMVRSVQHDKRTPGARLVDIVVRQDGVEKRIEADWVKKIARIVKQVEPKPL